MPIIYWAHSYRPEDAALNKHFGVLIENVSKMVVNFDPPSQTVNSSKLERNLLASDGMVAVLTWRANGPSPYILYEISLALRARKPLIVFLDDRLPDNMIPARVLQRRFSSRTYFRQAREHCHALRIFKDYTGDPPPERYQPSSTQRTCGMLGMDVMNGPAADEVARFVSARGYRPMDIRRLKPRNPLLFNGFESLASLDVVVRCTDSIGAESQFWTGAVESALVPSITFTGNPMADWDGGFPREFQPRLTDTSSPESLLGTLALEFGLFEQDFLESSNPADIERYTDTLVRSGSLVGRYESGTRGTFVEVHVGDQYTNSGQVGAMGRNARAQHMTFQQIWHGVEQDINLAALASELATLRAAMETEAKRPDEKLAVGAVAAAEESAKQKDGPKVLEYLKAGGRWALSMAEKVGTGIAKDALQKALGL